MIACVVRLRTELSRLQQFCNINTRLKKTRTAAGSMAAIGDDLNVVQLEEKRRC